MSHNLPQVADSRFRICWLREPSTGRLTADFSIPATAGTLRPSLHQLLGDVPLGAISALADHILNVSCSRREVELHLPFIDRANWSRRGDILANTGFLLYGSSYLPAALATPAARNRYYARVLAAAAFDPCAIATIEVPPHSMPAGLFSAWRMLPPENRLRYFAVLSSATVALQRTLREIVAAEWLGNLDNCLNVSHTCSLLAYAASDPCFGRMHSEFTFDLLGPKWHLSAFHAARRPLEGILAPLYSRFEAEGRPDLKALYANIDARGILGAIAREPSRVRGVFAAEQHVIDTAVLFVTGIRETMESRELAQRTVRFVEQFDVRLNRLKAGPLTHQIPRCLMEATRAVAEQSCRDQRAA